MSPPPPYSQAARHSAASSSASTPYIGSSSSKRYQQPGTPSMILSDDDGSETSSQTDPELPDSYDIDSDNAWPEALEALITDIKTVKPIHILLVLSIFILFTICVVLDISEYQNTQNSWVRDRIRTNWNNEQSSHIAFVRQYNVDKAAFQKDLYHHKEITSERAAEEKTRSQISDSRSQQEKEWEKKWKERKAIEGGWLEWERQMKEEKSSLRWSYPQAANANGRGKQCLGYGIREYTATLMHVPKGVSEKDILANCSRLPIEIHGVELSKPDFCDIVKSGWSNREYVGHWNLYSEPGCMTFWEKFEAKGCTGPHSGLYRYEANLGNFRYEDTLNPHDICQSTPAIIHGVHYGGPKSCKWCTFVYRESDKPGRIL